MSTKTKRKNKFKPQDANAVQAPRKKQKTSTGSSVIYLIGLGVICAIIILIRLNFLTIPFERDEGAYSYYGQLILDGKTPYISFYETKPPGLFYVYAFLQLVFGSTIEGLHLAGIVVCVISTIFVYKIAGKLMDKSAGLIAAASFGLLSLAKYIAGFTVQGEHMVVVFIVSGLWVLLNAMENRKALYLLGAGVLLCMSFMIKQNGLLYLLFGGGILITKGILDRPVSYKNILRDAGLYTAGALGLVSIFVLIIAVQNALSAFWHWVYVMPRAYTGVVTLKQGLEYFTNNFSALFQDNSLFIVIAGIGLVIVFASQLSLIKKLFIGGLTVFSFLSIVPGFWFYNHYFLLLMPSLALCIAAFFYTANEFLSKQINATVASAISLALFGFVLLQNMNVNREYFFNPNYTEILRQVYGMNPFPEAWEVSSVVKERTNEGDVVGVLGGEPEVFIYTGRRGPSSHDMAILLYGGSGIRTTEWQKGYIADVEKSKPKYFICFNNPISLMRWRTDTSLFTWFDKYMFDNYKLEGIADMVGPFDTRYVWDNAVNNYQVQSKEGAVYVFRRKE